MIKSLQMGCITEYEAQVYLDRIREDPLSHRFKIVTFRSTSNGKGRNPRPPRYVDLLVVKNKSRKYAFRIKDGEILPRQKKDGLSQPDQLAAEELTDLDWNDRTVEELLRRLEAIAQLGMLLKENGFL